jgi:hypothetical protein
VKSGLFLFRNGEMADTIPHLEKRVDVHVCALVAEWRLSKLRSNQHRSRPDELCKESSSVRNDASELSRHDPEFYRWSALLGRRDDLGLTPVQ